jgi:3-hydroxybutyryl-CoA dehydrogenase
MKLENVRQVAVLGAGAMGAQIAQLLAFVGGYSVTITDVKDEFIGNGIEFIKDGLKRHFVDKGKITQAQMDEVVGRIKGTTNLPDAAKNADFVIEAVFENLDVKKNVFKQLDENAAPDVIVASNTSALNLSEMASVTKRQDKVVGMHFFNPVAVMKLVEVIKGPLTSGETVNVAVALSKKLGKEPVVCKDFSYGFLANRAYAAMANEAVQMVWERVASPEEIDKALKLGYNLPMGVLELGDYTGMWALSASSEQDRMTELGPEKGHLHPLVRMMVRAGYTGGRGKKGIYDFYKEVLSRE